MLLLILLVIGPHPLDPYLVILKEGQVPPVLREYSLSWSPSWHVLVQLLDTLPHLSSFQILLHCYFFTLV
jgi:hypothetical protein